jgi:cytosine/adenosine deaminase-related metal-dependent hydrolase
VTVRVISAPWVLPGRGPAAGGAAPALRDGAVAFDGDAIVAVGKRAEIEALHGAGERLDAVLLPALVNAHLHLELSHMKGGVAGGEGLPAWIGLFAASRSSTRPGQPEQAMSMAAEDLRRAGVAAVGDVSNTLASLQPLAQAGMCGTVFHEVFGFTPERLERLALAAQAERTRRGPPPRGLRVLESPHAVYSTNRDGLGALLAAGPCSIHLAEHPAEREFCREGTGGFRRMNEVMGASGADIDALRVRGRSAVAAVAPLLQPHHLVVHCVDLDDEDLELLARSGATAVLCPRSNRYIVGLLPRLPALLEAGVPLAVGTDSLASSPSLAPLPELALLRREFPAVAAARLLPLAWNGAAVGAPGLGRLVPGSAPGVLAAPLEGARPSDPAAWLVETFGAEERPFTWIAQHRPEVAA